MAHFIPMPLTNRGVFITFEGTEGSGKSSLIEGLAQYCKRHQIDHLKTREPGGSLVAEAIRQVLLKDFKNQKMHPRTELFLYEAARIEHLEKVIKPALKAGKIVFCDRFTDSTLAYQAQARGLNWKMVENLNKSATEGIKPHLTLLLKLDPKIGLLRASAPNRFEREGVVFQNKVLKGFLRSAKADPRRWRILDVSQTTKKELLAATIQILKIKGWL